MKILSVNDHNKYRLFDYENEPSSRYKLGQVVFKKDENEIGVIIQTFSDDDFRTDMFGMASPSEVSFATLSQIKEYRPNLLIDLVDN